MGKIEVSVCIATYNQEKYIRQTLDSVFMQKTNFDFEVIIGEDASPDGTRKILLEYKEKYGDRLVLLLHDNNLGPSLNSRTIAEKARGKYVATVEGDDFWTDENKLQKQYDILENNPRYSAVCHDIMGVFPNGEVHNPRVLNLKKDCVKTMKDWLNEGYSVHTCSVFRRNIFPLYDERYIKLRTAEPTMGDVISFTLLYTMGDIYVFKDVMAAHRAAGNFDTTSYSYAQASKAIYYTQMYIRIVNNLEEYLNHEFDLSSLKCSRVASVKIRRLLGTSVYDKKEMKSIMKTFSFKMKSKVYYKMVRKIAYLAIKKIRRIYAK